MTKLLPFHTEISNAWKLFLHRWGSAALLQALSIIPEVLMFPLMSEYFTVADSGADVSVVFQSSLYGGQFLLGFTLFILLGVFVSTSTGILFAASEKISLWAAVKAALVRYVPVLYTMILAGFAVSISLIPVFLLNYAYTLFAQGGSPVSGNAIMAVDAIVFIAVIALFIPAVIVTIWVMYAPLAVALKAAPAGFTAIMFSKNLVHRHVWQLIWRMIGIMILFEIISVSVGALPYLSYLVPFILSIISIAFFVEIYKELVNSQG